MNWSGLRGTKTGGRRMRWSFWAFVLLMLGAAPAFAEDCVADLGGVLDGNVTPVAPSQIQVDGNCTIRNYPASNPLSTNFSFLSQPGQTDDRWLLIFDNVVHVGQMSCNDVQGHKIWFVNGASSSIRERCQNLLIPVEKIDKQNPAGQTTAAIGVPFTYRLTIPILYDPATGNTINWAGSPNELHSIQITDDLNATGVDLTYVSHNAYWATSGTPVPHSFSNVSGVLNFGNIPIVPAETQFIIEITVVLDDSPAVNTIGRQFINTASWQFGRLIDGTFYEPLPGEWGISPPMTIGAPNVVVTKSGPATMNLGAPGQFSVDALNNGTSDAWNLALVDRLPNGPSGGMCDVPPEIQSVTLGGTPLTQGTGYSTNFAGAPACELTLNLLDAAGPLKPDQHLLVTYRSRLDSDTQNGQALTNVAGVTRWYNGPSSAAATRQSFSRPVNNGTVGTLDNQDAHTVTASLLGFFFEKTVMNLRSGQNPATLAVPGDTLRYTLRLRSTTDPLNNFSFRDEMDALNAQAAFVPGSLTFVGALPAGAVNSSNANGGARGTGLIDIGNLNLAAGQQLAIQFDIRVAPTTTTGAVVSNQAQLLVANAPFMVSDDPSVNGQADPFVAGDEDPTRVTVALPALQFLKTVMTGATASPGDVVRYRLQLRNLSDFPFGGFSMVDEIDRLNTSPMFVPGTLTLASALPAGATSASSAVGGTKGTGLLDLRNLSIGAAGAANDTLTIEFTAQLAPVIDNGTVVLNQASVMVVSSELMKSDDPGIAGTEDPTKLVIASAPAFRVLKTSQDLTADPTILRAGERLRYTITVKNIGNSSAADVTMRDAIPVNTTYVAGSTTLNGALVADVAGTSPLVAGMPINAPENPTPGVMRADATATQANVATITFDVMVDPAAVDGTVISNQSFVSSMERNVVDTPSDDPNTPVLNDPTRNVVGYRSLLFADKRAALQVDNGTAGVVDPGDVLRYTITVYNTGTLAATGAVLRDVVPANTTYVANSLTLNGLPVGQPDGGVSPMIAGVNISSSDLTPPLPGAGQGTLSANQSAVVQFDMRVNDGVAAGTLIVNQATVLSQEAPLLLTDGDGNPSTGPEPTVVVVGPGPQISIRKQVAVVGGGPALAGSQLEYLVNITNIGAVPASYVEITDDLDANGPGYLTFVGDTATLNGATTGISITGSVLTADYFATYGALAPGQTAVLRFRAYIAQGLAIGTRVTNTAVVKWEPQKTASASVSIDVGGMVGVGILSGRAWHDANFNKTVDAAERVLEGWTVELYRNDRVAYTATTDATGVYRISGVTPNYQTEDKYELRFTAPGAGARTAKLGRADSAFGNGLQRIYDIVVQPGSNLLNLNLPIEPNGVIYNSMSRAPVPGVTVTMVQAGSRTALPEACFDDPAQQGQVALAQGYYRFDLNFADPACPTGGNFALEVTTPGPGYVAGYSQIIPPAAADATQPFSVPLCPGSVDDAIPATSQRCEVQPSEFQPGASIAARTAGTTYHVHLTLDDGQVPGSSQIFNNHIPLDPVLDGALAITKTTPMLNVTRGQLVPYTITVRNVLGMPLQDVRVADRFPAGFHYVPGSAQVDGVKIEPTIAGRELYWSNLSFGTTDQHTVVLLLAVGAGVSEGEFVNRAQAMNAFTGRALSAEATATVRIVPDPTFDCTDVTGKVFDDGNRNGLQDAGEDGLPGVRLVTTNGLVALTDAYGRFHITCAATPHEGRGSNFVLKLDDRTLPSGYRSSTDQVVMQRATRGKTLRFNFGASIHRAVSLDLADAVFEPGTTEIRLQWQSRMDLLLAELRKAPSVLRLSYLADVEDEQLVQRRLKAMKQLILDAWKAADSSYALEVEPEVFWRRGGPPKPARPGADR